MTVIIPNIVKSGFNGHPWPLQDEAFQLKDEADEAIISPSDNFVEKIKRDRVRAMVRGFISRDMNRRR